MEIRVEVLRHGSAAAQLRATLSSTSKPGPGLEVAATFARERPGPDALGSTMPVVPAPDDCEAGGDRALRDDGTPRWQVPFFANFDIMLALGDPLWKSGWTAGEARMAFWYRYRSSQQRADGRFDPLALPPIADTMPSALARKLGPEHPLFFAPSLDLTVHFLEPSDDEWFLVDVRCPRARSSLATANAEIWDRSGHLVATATQMMMIRTRPNDPRR